MNGTENGTTTPPIEQACAVHLYDILPLVLIQALSFMANALAAIAIWRLPGLDENKNHLIVRTLVVSDLLIPLPMLPFAIASYSNCEWFGGQIACTITAFLSTAFLSWSVFIVFVLCMLRYLAVTRPLWYRKHVTYLRVKIALVVAFAWACIHLLLPLAGIGKFRLYEKGFYCALDLTPERSRDKALVYLVIFEGIFSTVALLYSCVVIIMSLVRRRRRVSEQLSVNQRHVGGVAQMKRQHEGYARLTLVIVILFCACYVPFLSYRLIILVQGSASFNNWSYYYTELLAHVSPLLNPVVYIMCNQQYRTSVKKVLTKCSLSCFVTKNAKDMYGRNIELRKMSAFSTRTESILLD